MLCSRHRFVVCRVVFHSLRIKLSFYADVKKKLELMRRYRLLSISSINVVAFNSCDKSSLALSSSVPTSSVWVGADGERLNKWRDTCVGAGGVMHH